MARKAFKLPGKTIAKPKRVKKPVQLVKQGCVLVNGALILQLPIKLESEANRRDHWRVKAKRVAGQRGLVEMFAKSAEVLHLPVVVQLIRIAPRKLDDDNLRGALKACRDGVADWFGVADNNSRIEWRYTQESIGQQYGCTIIVQEKLEG